ncbi:juvenile hormone epoxide hydrolase-like [Manduca sexta]|uniref:juvenile hormone epoxide hydrolase-like n=1 Tax=Manduca sexta TaxID=7130 RepID=UPI00188F8174|nr:juvenile hormone epoxide hydrolase-like [Manduca sexta]
MHSWLVLSLVAAVAGYDYTTVPGLNHDTWWGPEGKEEDTSIRPFQIKWEKAMIDDLVYRLENRRKFVPSMDDTAYHYGVNTHTIGYWLDYWARDYNFTAREAYVNKHPQFITNMQGLDVHFVRIVPEVPEGKRKIPLLLLHGFPGSFLEFHEAIDHLIAGVADKDFVFEIVAPSLIGFGYSDYTNKQGLGGAEMAVIFKKLMNRLGHEKFFVQGGDWGAHIADIMVVFFQEEIIGMHTNLGMALTDKAFSMISMGSLYPEALMPNDLIGRLYPLKDTLQWLMREFGYFHFQATKPDTIGICVTDTPSGMFAWFAQLISMASRRANYDDPRGGLDLYTPEQLIDNAMIYWAPNKASSAMRIYAETVNWRNYDMGFINEPSSVPIVVVQAPDEIYYMPPAALNTKYTNLVAVDVLSEGGHFLAYEMPEQFAKLVISAVERILNHKQCDKSEL